MKLSKIKNIGRFKHKVTLQTVNIKQGRNMQRGTDLYYYLFKGKRKFITDKDFYENWTKDPKPKLSLVEGGKKDEKPETMPEGDNVEHKYLLTQRPPSIGTHPLGSKDKKEIKLPSGRRAWELTYDRKLTNDEIKSFELTDINKEDNKKEKESIITPNGRKLEINIGGEVQTIKPGDIVLDVGFDYNFEIAPIKYKDKKDGFVIIEPKTGMRVSDGFTKKEAIDKAEKQIKVAGKDKFNKMVNDTLEDQKITKQNTENLIRAWEKMSTYQLKQINPKNISKQGAKKLKELIAEKEPKPDKNDKIKGVSK